MFSFLSLSAQSGSITVKGVVKDVQGEPVIGASVVVKGTTTGSMTDLDGRYSVTASPNATLEVSFLGYKTQTIQVSNRTEVNIVLQDDTELLDEVVVIGYGTVKKTDATGSLTAIKVDEMNKGVVTTAQDMLAGKIAGVSVISEGGRPGDGAKIRIRGGSSLSATNDPLVIIDGVIISNDLAGSSNFLSTINPADIETFTVLKDASATAIYGSRASNGVILITTKKGSITEGKGNSVRVTYNGTFSLSTKRNSVDVMGGDEYYRFIADRFYGTSQQNAVIPMLGKANTNWQDEIYKTAFGTDHNVSVYGGIAGVLPYRASVGYTNQEGILRTSKLDRVTANISLTPSFFDDHLKLNINAKGMYSKTRFADTGAVGSSISFDPTQPVKNGSIWGGYYTWTNAAGQYASIAGKNPVAMLEMQNNAANTRNFIGNIQADYKLHFFPDLRINLNLGIDVATTNGRDYKSPFNPTAYQENDDSGQRKSFENLKNNQLFEVYAQYLKEVASIKSKFDVMGGYSWQRYKKTNNEISYYVSKEDFSNLDVSNPYFKDYREYYLISFYGRFNYTFDDKYLLTFTLRDDGSSRFAKGNRWGVFPALALAWKMKEETFLKDVTALNDLKLRLGWGKTGQQEIEGDEYYYPAVASYIVGKEKGYYPMGRNEDGSVKWVKIMKPQGYNPLLKWETTTTWNVGVDYGFLNNRINGAIDFYFRKTEDLINKNAPVVAGTNLSETLIQNIGTLENKGIEFSINARPVVTKDFEWQLGFNVAYNKGKITKLVNYEGEGYNGYAVEDSSSGDGGDRTQRYMTGYAPRTFYVYEQVYDEHGKPIEGVYVDRNEDGKIDEEDLYFHKKPAADVLMGFNTKIVYKNWDFGFNGRVSLGNYAYNAAAANEADISNNTLFANSIFLINRPKSAFKTNFTSKQALSDYYVQNASFLKIDNITLGYTFDNLLKNKLKARVYATVQNPIIITKYDGLDPEVSNNGIDYNLYPRPLTFLLGFNLNF